MNIHVDTLFIHGGRAYRPGPADAPAPVAEWAIARGYARPYSAAPEAAPENKAHASAPKRAVKPKTAVKDSPSRPAAASPLGEGASK